LLSGNEGGSEREHHCPTVFGMPSRELVLIFPRGGEPGGELGRQGHRIAPEEGGSLARLLELGRESTGVGDAQLAVGHVGAVHDSSPSTRWRTFRLSWHILA